MPGDFQFGNVARRLLIWQHARRHPIWQVRVVTESVVNTIPDCHAWHDRCCCRCHLTQSGDCGNSRIQLDWQQAIHCIARQMLSHESSDTVTDCGNSGIQATHVASRDTTPSRETLAMSQSHSNRIKDTQCSQPGCGDFQGRQQKPQCARRDLCAGNKDFCHNNATTSMRRASAPAAHAGTSKKEISVLAVHPGNTCCRAQHRGAAGALLHSQETNKKATHVAKER